LTAPENPPGFVVRIEAQKAAFDNGFRIERGAERGWMRFGSATARGDIWIAGGSQVGPWLLSVSHAGVAAELAPGAEAVVEGPGVATILCSSLPALYAAVERSYQLGVSLPDAPLDQFRRRVAGLPRTTEVERLVVQRVGQNIFRDALVEYWNGRYPMTGITDQALLRASHIVPWAECDNDAHRLDVHNGLLLSALWDAAFDAGRVSFADTGEILLHPGLGPVEREVLTDRATPRLKGETSNHFPNLARHWARFGL
jgi:hypothetical protein